MKLLDSTGKTNWKYVAIVVVFVLVTVGGILFLKTTEPAPSLTSIIQQPPPAAPTPTVRGILFLKTIGHEPAPSPTPSAQQTPPSTPSAQPQAMDTNGWQTYRNSEFGFEFQYPQDWDALESKSPGYPYLAYVDLGPKSSIQEGGVFAVMVRDQDKNTYLNSLRNGGFVLKREEEVMIYGEKATRYMFTRMNSSGEWKSIIIMRGNVLLEFSSGATEGQDEKFHQILSTFRFVP